jgi:hypothetical protein
MPARRQAGHMPQDREKRREAFQARHCQAGRGWPAGMELDGRSPDHTDAPEVTDEGGQSIPGYLPVSYDYAGPSKPPFKHPHWAGEKLRAVTAREAQDPTSPTDISRFVRRTGHARTCTGCPKETRRMGVQFPRTIPPRVTESPTRWTMARGAAKRDGREMCAWQALDVLKPPNHAESCCRWMHDEPVSARRRP